MKQLAVPVVSLPRSLTSLETWGFGFSGLLLWLGTAPAMHAALEPQALWVWLPGTIVGMLLNLQVKRLGTHFPDVAGGTPNLGLSRHKGKKVPDGLEALSSLSLSKAVSR